MTGHELKFVSDPAIVQPHPFIRFYRQPHRFREPRTHSGGGQAENGLKRKKRYLRQLVS